jgi:hypothetical protein
VLEYLIWLSQSVKRLSKDSTYCYRLIFLYSSSFPIKCSEFNSIPSTAAATCYALWGSSFFSTNWPSVIVFKLYSTLRSLLLIVKTYESDVLERSEIPEFISIFWIILTASVFVSNAFSFYSCYSDFVSYFDILLLLK